MKISNDYLNVVKNPPKLTNEEFLGSQILQLKYVFVNELAAIKNNKLEFVAYTEKLSDEFNLGPNVIGNTFNVVDNVAQHIRDQIHTQEMQLMQDRVVQSSFYFFKRNRDILNYMVRKRPLINPATNDVVGILILTEKITPNIHRRFIVNQFLQIPGYNTMLESINLALLHRQIVFCLLVGINNRKEIASTLVELTSM